MRFPFRLLLALLIASPAALHAQEAPAPDPEARQQPVSGEDTGPDAESGQISTAIVEEAAHGLEPIISRMDPRALRASVYAMADEAQTHLDPGMPSSQLDADFQNFSVCLADNLSSMRLNRTYPEIISSAGLFSAAEDQIRACSPFVQTRSVRLVGLVARLLEHFLPHD